MRHCLIVDSSPIIRKVAASILVGVGERAEEASSEAQAIAHCRIEMPDLILIDWKLKDGSALALLDQLMALTRLRKPHVVVLSTAHDPHIVEMALEAGADEIVLKPFDRSDLLSVLAQTQLAA